MVRSFKQILDLNGHLILKIGILSLLLRHLMSVLGLFVNLYIQLELTRTVFFSKFFKLTFQLQSRSLTMLL